MNAEQFEQTELDMDDDDQGRSDGLRALGDEQDENGQPDASPPPDPLAQFQEQFMQERQQSQAQMQQMQQFISTLANQQQELMRQSNQTMEALRQQLAPPPPPPPRQMTPDDFAALWEKDPLKAVQMANMGTLGNVYGLTKQQVDALKNEIAELKRHQEEQSSAYANTLSQMSFKESGRAMMDETMDSIDREYPFLSDKARTSIYEDIKGQMSDPNILKRHITYNPATKMITGADLAPIAQAAIGRNAKLIMGEAQIHARQPRPPMPQGSNGNPGALGGQQFDPIAIMAQTMDRAFNSNPPRRKV